jgi:hypothetical protein
MRSLERVIHVETWAFEIDVHEHLELVQTYPGGSTRAAAQLAFAESPNKDKAMNFARHKRYLTANQVVLG